MLVIPDLSAAADHICCFAAYLRGIYPFVEGVVCLSGSVTKSLYLYI